MFELGKYRLSDLSLLSFCIFHCSCLICQIIALVLQVLPTSKQCVTFTAECQICIGCIGNTFICVCRIHDTEVVKLPYLPEYVSSKCSKEESKMCSFLEIHGYYFIKLLFLGDQKNKIGQLLDANSPGGSAITFLNEPSHRVV